MAHGPLSRSHQPVRAKQTKIELSIFGGGAELRNEVDAMFELRNSVWSYSVLFSNSAWDAGMSASSRFRGRRPFSHTIDATLRSTVHRALFRLRAFSTYV